MRKPTEEYLSELGNVRDEYELALEGSVDLVYSNGRPDKVYDEVLKYRKTNCTLTVNDHDQLYKIYILTHSRMRYNMTLLTIYFG